MRFATCLLLLSSCCLTTLAQTHDTVSLNSIQVKAYKTFNGVGHINETAGQVIYSGKKNEVLAIDSLNANKAVNNTRQIIGRIPGLNIIETEAGGFTANGIGFRGINPYQSIEMNTRQNGYNISADIFGYNEAYYLPPMEAVGNIQFMRGAAGLQFGPQLGGMVNYIIKDAPAKPFEMTVAETAGSYGLSNTYASAGGTKGKWQYFGFVQYRTMDGWRANSDQKQTSAYAKVAYNASEKVKLSLEYTLLRNRIHMPGGLNDSEFAQNPQLSLRARNWLQSPWNIVNANLQYKLSQATTLSLSSSYQFSERSLIWQNEDSWYPNFAPDSVGAGRELEREYFNNLTNELRLLTTYKLGGREHSLAYGIRQAFSLMRRYEGGEGSTGSGFDLKQFGDYATAMTFRNNNVSAFAENIFHVGDKLSITPGFRFEYLTTEAYGIAENHDDTNGTEPELNIDHKKNTRTFALAGLGLQYEITNKINAYANCSQSYRPVTYSNLTPFGTTAKIDQGLNDSRAVNADLGVRGTVKNIVNFDAGLFYLYSYNGIGTIHLNDTTSLVTNTGASVHTGVETYGEINISKLLFPNAKIGKISLYNSFAYVNAVYTSGDFKGNQVEYAPHVIERAGLSYRLKGFDANFQFSSQSKSYGDAANTVSDASAETGIIPAYWVMDISTAYKWKQFKLSLGVNNLADAKYFTLRTSEYPGPGIIPSNGRTVYGGVSVTF